MKSLAVTRLITPLERVKLPKYDTPVWCKLEFLNPSGSTSIAMALVSAQLGVSFVAVMPHRVSQERIKIIRAYGAAIELTPNSNSKRRAS